MLQTYAAQTAVEKMGYSVEILDYVPEGLSFKRAVWPKDNTAFLIKTLKLLPLIICNAVQFRIVNKFIIDYIKISERRYKSYSEILRCVPDADVYLSGSDQIWNTQNNNPPEDIKAYYLSFVPPGKRKVAYAGSFGKTVFSENETHEIYERLSSYDALSVREDTAVKTLEDAGIYNVVHVVDPTLLLTPEEWMEFCVKKPPEPGYIFIYNLNRNKIIKELARKISTEKKLRIVNFADTLEFIPHAENRIINTALDFLNYIIHADFVLTDSFHGAAFSLNFNKQFISVPAPKYNSRLESILRITGLLESRYADSVEKGMKAVNTEIDYRDIRKLLERERIKSQMYLKKALPGDNCE